MAGPCPAIADTLTRQLGGFTCDAPAVVQVRSPFGLSNATLPVIELTFVLGALLAVVHAVRRLRRDRDPAPLVLMGAGLVYLAVIEPPLYFPGLFGLERSPGLMFVHNEFTVTFLYGRLPLYIIAIYLSLPLLAFEIVRALGVFRHRGSLLGALCTGAVHSAFYEVFDHLGPQLRWWRWNEANPVNSPSLGSVPLGSVTLFAVLSPAALAYLADRLVTRRLAQGSRISPGGYLWRTALTGFGAVIAEVLGGAPASALGGHPSRAWQAVVYGTEFVLVWAVAVPVLARAWQRERRAPAAGSHRYAQVFGSGYLVILAALWVTALPAYTGAAGGITADGTAIGSLPFAALCFAAAATALAGVATLPAPPAAPGLAGPASRGAAVRAPSGEAAAGG